MTSGNPKSKFFYVCVAMVAAASVGPGDLHGDLGLPPTRVVLDRIVERAAEMAWNGHTYTYQKKSVLEQLDARGNVTETVERLYRVDLIQGIPFPRLVKIQGRDLTDAEIRAENDRERAFRNRVTGTDPNGMVERNEPLVTHELLDRYHFTLEGEETLQNRRAFILSFRPRLEGISVRSIKDRILARLAGRIWVDDEDAEVARLEVGLTQGFSLGWLGLLGSLQECDLNLERQRLDDGHWVPVRQSLMIVGRRLISPMRYRTIEESHDFTRQ